MDSAPDTCPQTELSCGPATRVPKETDESSYTVYLKVLSPADKKDFNMFTLRDIKPTDISTPDELQCEELAKLPRTLEFKIGYFYHSQKLWINSQKDIQDAWNVFRNNDRLTFWCIGSKEKEKQGRKRSMEETSDDELSPCRSVLRQVWLLIAASICNPFSNLKFLV